MFLVCSKICYI